MYKNINLQKHEKDQKHQKEALSPIENQKTARGDTGQF